MSDFDAADLAECQHDPPCGAPHCSACEIQRLNAQVRETEERIQKMVDANREWQRRRTAELEDQLARGGAALEESQNLVEAAGRDVTRLLEERARQAQNILKLVWYGGIMSFMIVEQMEPEQDDFEAPWKLDGEEYEGWNEMLRGVAEQHGITKPHGLES